MDKATKILVINSGSSSIKYQLFNMPYEEVLCSGQVERIGGKISLIRFRTKDYKVKRQENVPDHRAGLDLVVQLLLDPHNGVIASKEEIVAVGHRVVHGGATFSDTTIVDKKVKDKIRELFSLAPQHNPPNLEGIEVAAYFFPQAKQVAVFDTAFHQSIPREAYQYAIPQRFLIDHKIRKYGFHGTSHKFVSEQAMAHLDLKETRLISIHLGNGCSISAIKNGRSVDHSLGFGPIVGLVMGTRSGDLDQSIIFHMVDNLGFKLEEVKHMLQNDSGMLGLTGYSDLRDIEDRAMKGDATCAMALSINAYRIKKYIGAYAAAMNGLDALIFTAGIGENSEIIRRLVCNDLEFLGVALDETKNQVRAKALTEIHRKGSRVKILVIPTNEELEIARQTYKLLN
jgi:acetate kinase